MPLSKKVQRNEEVKKMMFSWTYAESEPQQIKFFLKAQGISRGLLAKVKFQGGHISVNGTTQNVLYYLQPDDVLAIEIPDEKEHETLLRDETPLEIIFEDDHYLIVNKPYDVASIPAQYHPNGTMANRVKHYICEQGYKDQVVHVVTRLDRDTTGLMLFAKHGFAHAMLDQELREKRVIKKYQALVGGAVDSLKEHDIITLKIERDPDSILKRQTGPGGLESKTEYWLMKRTETSALVDIQLHTGRTHQIRVHFEAIECPLLGDEMYHGDVSQGIERQALHCGELIFTHPFTKEVVHCQLPLAPDMLVVYNQMVE